jgi:hypothetical protein
MENKTGFWSKLLRRKRPKESPPAQNPVKPTPSQEQPLSAPQERKAMLKERQKQEEQKAFSYTVEQAQSGQEREKFTPKGAPKERFRRIIQAETKIAEKRTPETTTKPVDKTLSERRVQEVDRELLAKSITKPTWPKEKAQEKTPVEQKSSVPPFVPGTPGVEKWQPGKGAISIDEVKKIKEKLKTDPVYSPEKSKEQS